MKDIWMKNIRVLLLTLLLGLSLVACGSSGGGGSSGNSSGNGNDNGNPKPPASTYQLVAVGNSGTVITSDDKDNWNIVQTGTNQIIWDVAHGSWFAVGRDLDTGKGTIARSDDSGNWSVVHGAVDGVYYGITSNGSGTWIAVGEDSTNNRVISITADNGNIWIDSISVGALALNEIAYGNGFWVAVGKGGAIITSTDGSTWTPVTTSGTTSDLTGVAYGNDHWIAVSDGGNIVHAVTADLSIWSHQFTAPRDLTDIAYNGTGRWVTVGNEGIIFYSDDNGATWTESEDSHQETQNNLKGVVYDGTDWVAVGTTSATATKPTIIHTRNGDIDIWDKASGAPATNEHLQSIAFRP